MISWRRDGARVVGNRPGAVPGRPRGPAAPHTDAVVIFTVFGRMHVYRFGSVPMTLLVQLPGWSGDPTMWAANMPTGAAERAVHAVEISR